MHSSDKVFLEIRGTLFAASYIFALSNIFLGVPMATTGVNHPVPHFILYPVTENDKSTTFYVSWEAYPGIWLLGNLLWYVTFVSGPYTNFAFINMHWQQLRRQYSAGVNITSSVSWRTLPSQ